MVTDEESLSAWTRFLTEYANGVFNSPTHPPVLTDDLQAILNREPSSSKVEEETAVYKSGEIDQDTAARVRRFYCERKFLPPPRSSRESVRLRVLAEYDISGPEQMTNLQDSVELLAAFFPGVLCTFSLFKGDEQYHYAVSGPNWIKEKYNVYVGVRIPSEDSLCGHAVLAKGGATACQVLEGDWRYIQNPFKVAGFKTYASTVVNLPLDPSAVSEDGEQVGIGTLNLCFVDNAPAELTETQKNVTIQITRNLAKQLRATWDGHRRTKVANIQRGLSEYIREALVLEGIDSPDMSRMGHKPAMNGHVSIVKSNSKSTTGKATARMDLRSMAQDACTRISEVLPRITALQIIDLRSISLITDRRDEKAFVEDPDSFFPIQIIATSLNSVDRGRDGTTTAMIKQSILDYLQTTLTTNPTVQDVSMLRQTGFEAILPPDTRNFLAIPFFSADCSIFMIIASVDRDVSRLDESDQIAIDMFGSILRARAVQADLMTLDKAKTAFLSSISHELRTPMHGVLTGLELLRGAMETGNTEQAEMLIEVAETSGKMLQGLLNDVLDFGSLKGSENRQSKVDLAATAVATAKTCALRMDQSPATVAMSVEYEDRPWEVMIDEAGYQRILINGITNAIKFTKSGSITVKLTLTDDQRQIVIRIIDTGIGVTSDFRAHLFEPFTKSDPHSPGAGLGLHITKTLVARMSGTLALIPNEGRCGSTFQVVLPVIVSQEGLARDKRYEIIHVPVHGRPVAGTKHRDSRSAGPAVPAEIAKPAQSKISAGIGGTGKSQTGRLRVLVVDDNIVNRKLLSLAIKKSPYAPVIYQAIDGENAIEMYRKIDPHLIFTDVSMPIMDGLTATSRIRELEEEKSDGTRCVIYALTGVGSNDVRLRLDSMMGKAALDGWLVKGEHDLSTIRSIISVTVERFALDDNAY